MACDSSSLDTVDDCSRLKATGLEAATDTVFAWLPTLTPDSKRVSCIYKATLDCECVTKRHLKWVKNEPLSEVMIV